MKHKKYTESKFYIAPEFLIIIGIVLITFWPITIYFYAIPLFSYCIGAILIWNNEKKLLNKILWTVIPIILGLLAFKLFVE